MWRAYYYLPIPGGKVRRFTFWGRSLSSLAKFLSANLRNLGKIIVYRRNASGNLYRFRKSLWASCI